MPKDLIERILDLAVEIQQIPAPTFFEERRAEFIRKRFLAEDLGRVSQDKAGNVYACLVGQGEAAPVVVSAHLDTVFPMQTELAVLREAHAIAGAGIGDNSLGLAGLFGLVWALKERGINLPGDVWLVANVGEEGLGDLNGMRAVVERFSNRARAYVVLEGMSLGQVFHRGLGVRRYRIGVVTPGGHSWVNKDRPSAIHELARLVTRLIAISIPQQPRTTINVGMINGGISVNTIAPEAYLELDLRSEAGEALERLSDQVLELVEAANSGEVQATAEVIGERPQGAIPANHPLTRLAMACLEAQGIQPQLNIGSTDANIPLSRGLPAVCIGLTTGSGAHTTGETIDTRPLGKGMEQLVMLVEGVFSL
jgi:tripeptide aminopeptidase